MKLTKRSEVVIIAVGVLLLAAIGLGVAFRATVFQEDNPFRLAIGVIRVLLPDDGIGQIPGAPERYVKCAGSGEKWVTLYGLKSSPTSRGSVAGRETDTRRRRVQWFQSTNATC